MVQGKGPREAGQAERNDQQAQERGVVSVVAHETLLQHVPQPNHEDHHNRGLLPGWPPAQGQLEGDGGQGEVGGGEPVFGQPASRRAHGRAVPERDLQGTAHVRREVGEALARGEQPHDEGGHKGDCADEGAASCLAPVTLAPGDGQSQQGGCYQPHVDLHEHLEPRQRSQGDQQGVRASCGRRSPGPQAPVPARQRGQVGAPPSSGRRR